MMPFRLSGSEVSLAATGVLSKGPSLISDRRDAGLDCVSVQEDV